MMESETKSRTGEHGWGVLGILSALMGFASISTDLYLPAMPAIARDLHADQGSVELTVAVYLIGFSLGQLVWGPVGDRVGRRLPIAIGLVLFIVGSIGCAMAGDIRAVLAWRVLQALGACASVVLARAMVRDLYAGHRAAQMMSTLLMVMAIAPLLGPILGGQILVLAGWRAIFWTLVGVGILTLGALFTLPETLPHDRRNHDPVSRAFAAYVRIARDRKLIGYAAAGGFFYAGMFAYVAGSPFSYIAYYHVSAQAYGLLFGVGIVGIMLSNFFNARLMATIGLDALLRFGTAGVAIVAISLAFDARTGFGGLAGLAIPLALFVCATGFVVANSIAGALERFPDRSGLVSALVGSVQYGSGFAGSAIVGAFANGTPWPMAYTIAICGIASFVSTLLVTTRSRGSGVCVPSTASRGVR